MEGAKNDAERKNTKILQKLNNAKNYAGTERCKNGAEMKGWQIEM